MRSITRLRTFGSLMRAKARLRCSPSAVDRNSTTNCDEDSFGETFARRADRRRAVEEKGWRDVQRLRNLLEPARADAIGALLVFLHLLEGQPQRFAELLLAHFQQDALHAHAASDMPVYRIGRLLHCV